VSAIRFGKTLRFPWAADEPWAYRKLIMKALRQDVANLAFHHSWRSAGFHLGFFCWTRNASTAIHRDFFKESAYFSYADNEKVYLYKYIFYALVFTYLTYSVYET